MVKLPSQLKEPIPLADWMEMIALLSPDGNASFGDLSSALRRTGAYEFDEDDILYSSIADDERIEEMCAQVFLQLQQRERFADKGYPFEVDNGVLKQKQNTRWQNYIPYVFCLCLSFFDPLQGKDQNRPRMLFEDLSKIAAQNFIAGEALRFGFPRSDMPSNFSEAVDALCSVLGEGEGYRKRLNATVSAQDDRLDIVAWRDFPDKLPGKLILFGQCASNKNWEGWRAKLSDLNPKEFCQQWMVSMPTHEPMKSFFVPHCIERKNWEYSTRYAGVLFDRCRIALCAHNSSSFIDHMEFIQTVYFSDNFQG